MKRTLSYIALVLILLAAGCSRKPKLISEENISKIHMEMLLADQWLKSGNNRRQADTSLVYAPIFEKYGYTVEDYRYSVDHYLDMPEKFSKIFDRTTELLNIKLDSVNRAQRSKHKADSTLRALLAIDIPRPEMYSKFFEDIYARDSFAVHLDSMGVYRLERILHDTMFKGPLLVIKEKPRPDSLAADADSLLNATDSLRRIVIDTSVVLEKVPSPLKIQKAPRKISPSNEIIIDKP